MDKALERSITLASMSLRDYFSTFSTYATATTILVAAVGLLREDLGESITLVLSLLGLWICLQWYVATFGMRLQYRYYLSMIEILRRDAPDDTPPLFNPKRDRSELGLHYPWPAQVHEGFWGTRGASLPLVYAIIFLVLFCDSLRKLAGGASWWIWLISLAAGIVFVVLNRKVSDQRQQRPKWPDWRNGQSKMRSKPGLPSREEDSVQMAALSTKTRTSGNGKPRHLEAYGEGSAACRNYSGLTMRVRTLALVVAAAAIAVPFAGTLTEETRQLAFVGGSAILVAVAISFCLVDWHYQSAFAGIRDSLATMEAECGLQGPWRAHLKKRTHLGDHFASYVPFLLLGLIAALALSYAMWESEWSSCWRIVGIAITWVFFGIAVGMFIAVSKRARDKGKELQENLDKLAGNAAP